MALNNNIYFNAAYVGFYAGALSGRALGSIVAADYAALKSAAVVMATAVDALIAFDALVTTAMSNTELVDTASNTIQADERWRAQLLTSLCRNAVEGRNPINSPAASALFAASTQPAAIVAQFTEGLVGLVTP